MKYSRKLTLPAGLRGMDLLERPVWNKGTAFDDRERLALGLRGLLPPQVETLQEQLVRVMKLIKRRTRISGVTSICVSCRIPMKPSFTD